MEVIQKYKCNKCNYETMSYSEGLKHDKNHTHVDKFLKLFPEIKDDTLNFANGKYYIQRSKKWYNQLKSEITKLVNKIEKITFTPFTYGWYRSLDDGNSMVYKYACRYLNVCSICYKEYGQSYFANMCDHKKEKEFNKKINLRR